jgi:hypothetical protein
VRFLYELKGFVNSEGGEIYMLGDEFLDDTRDWRLNISDRTPLTDPLASVALIEYGIKNDLIKILPQNRYYDAEELFNPPSFQLRKFRERYRKDASQNDDYEIWRGVYPMDVPAWDSEKRVHAEKLRQAFSRIKIDHKYTEKFGSPDFFVKNVTLDSFHVTLGAAIRDNAVIVTSNRSFYNFLRKNLFSPIHVSKLVKSNVFAEMIRKNPRSMTAFDALIILEDYKLIDSYAKIIGSLQSLRPRYEEIGTYFLAEAAGVIFSPLSWVVKPGCFLAKELRRRI